MVFIASFHSAVVVYNDYPSFILSSLLVVVMSRKVERQSRQTSVGSCWHCSCSLFSLPDLSCAGVCPVTLGRVENLFTSYLTIVADTIAVWRNMVPKLSLLCRDG